MQAKKYFGGGDTLATVRRLHPHLFLEALALDPRRELYFYICPHFNNVMTHVAPPPLITYHIDTICVPNIRSYFPPACARVSIASPHSYHFFTGGGAVLTAIEMCASLRGSNVTLNF